MMDEAIRLGDAHCFVDVRAVERMSGPGQDGDLRLEVTARMERFEGWYENVWIASDDWRAFIDAMRRLERERLGRASLLSMSPEEFELHLQIVSPGGQVTAFGRLSRYHFGHPSGTATKSRIDYHCPVDPSMLREIVEAFVSLPGENI
jgi:hypothetical protein